MKPGTWLVMNFVTLENLATATHALSSLNATWDVLQLQAARSKPILHMHRMAAENPVWIVCAQAGEAMPSKEHPVQGLALAPLHSEESLGEGVR